MAIVLETLSDSRAAREDLKKLRTSVETIETSANKATSALKNIVSSFALGFSGIAGLKAIVDASDSITNLESKLKVSSDSFKEFNVALRETRRIALENNVAIEDTTRLYSRLSLSGKSLGLTQKELIETTELVSKAIKASGASTQESKAAIQQLSQAMGSNNFAGDELKSVLENSAILAKNIAAGLGVTVGMLKDMGAKGQITTRGIVDALKRQSAAINESAGKITITYGMAFQNISNAMGIFAAEVKKAFTGEGGGIPEAINKVALKIYEFSTKIEFYLLRTKINFLTFAIFIVELFEPLVQPIINFGSAVKETFLEFLPYIKPVIKEFLSMAAAIASVGFERFIDFSKKVYGVIKDTLGNINFKEIFTTLAKKFKDTLVSTFSNIKNVVVNIDVRNFFPGLDVALDYVRSWVQKINGFFAWLYDKVVGNSWIPDLVLEVTAWLKKLLTTPLSTIQQFVTAAGLKFSWLAETVSAGLAVKTIYSYRSALLSLGKVLGAVGVAAAAFQFFDLKDGKVTFSFEQGKSRIEDFLKKIADAIEGIWKKFSDSFAGAEPVKAIKGVMDKRKEEDKPLIPTSLKLGAITAIAGALSLLIATSVKSEIVAIALLTAIGSAYAAAIASVAVGTQISDFFSEGAYSFIKIIKKGVDLVFGKDVLKEPLTFAATLLKVALLFSAGRAAIGSALVKIGTSPTKAAVSLNDVFAANQLKKSLEPFQRTVNTFQSLENTQKRAQKDFENIARELARARDPVGGRIGQQRANDMISRNVLVGGNANITGLLQAANASKNILQNAQTVVNTNKNAADLAKAAISQTQGRIDALNARVQEAKEQARQGIINTGAGLGGALGGVAGFQIATEFTKKMSEDVPAWQKVALIITGSIGGQAIGAAVGIAATNALLFGAGVVGRGIGIAFAGAVNIAKMAYDFGSFLIFALGIKFVALAVLFAAIIVAAFNWDSVKSTFTYLGDALNNFWKFTWNWGLNKFFKPENWGAVDNKGQVNLGAAAAKSNAGNVNLIGADPETAFGYTIAELQAKRAATNEKLKKEFDKQQEENAKIISESFGKKFPPVADQIAGKISDELQKSLLKQFSTGNDFPLTNANPNSPIIKKATGGWISGPGTGTSDSIPAMLSNGEFVVNAKAAKKNWELLSAINSGKTTKFFAEGTDSTNLTQLDKNGKLSADQVFGLLNVKYRLPVNANKLKTISALYGEEAYREGKFVLQPYDLLRAAGKNASAFGVSESAFSGGLAKAFLKSADFLSEKLSSLVISGALVSKLIPPPWSMIYSMLTAVADIGYPIMGGVVRGLDVAGAFKSYPEVVQAAFNTVGEADTLHLNLIAEGIFNAVDFLNQQSKQAFPSLSKAYTEFLKILVNKFAMPEQQQAEGTLLKAATGGFIKGPGSGTSDSIPAMLSNGEFVVNAKSAKKNWELLSAINSGASTEYFAGGSDTTKLAPIPGTTPLLPYMHGPVPVKVENTDDFAGKLAGFVKNAAAGILSADNYKAFAGQVDKVTEAVREVFKGSKPPGASAAGSGSSGETIGSVESAVRNTKNVKEMQAALLNPLKSLGNKFSEIDPEDLTGISASNAMEISKALDEVAKFRREAEKAPPMSQGLHRARIENAEKALYSLLKRELPAGSKGQIAAAAAGKGDDVKPVELNVGLQLRYINDIFEALNLNYEELSRLPDSIRNKTFKTAVEVTKLRNAVDSIPLGTLDNPLINLAEVSKTVGPDITKYIESIMKEKGVGVREAIAFIVDKVKTEGKAVADEVQRFRRPGQEIMKRLSATNFSMEFSIYDQMNDTQRKDFKALVDTREAAMKTIQAPESDTSITDEMRKNAYRVLTKTEESLKQYQKEIPRQFLPQIEQLQAVLQDSGLYIEKGILNVVSDLDLVQINDIAARVKAAESTLKSSDLTEASRIAAQNLINQSRKDLAEALRKYAPDFKSKTELLGEDFGNSVGNIFTSAFAGLLKGRRENGKGPLETFANQFLDNITNTVIDTLVKGMMEPITGEKGILTTSIKEIGTKIAELFVPKDFLKANAKPKAPTDPSTILPTQDEADALAPAIAAPEKALGIDPEKMGFMDLFKDLGTKFMDGFKSFGSMLTGIDFGSLFTGAFDLFKKGLSLITGLFGDAPGLATGGFVSGPGTGTSDSIPAMLSNGEFVINARATKSNLGLLKAINSGSLKGFAEGGLVTAMPTISSPQTTNVNSNSKSSQVFNINITGDISRQTKREILTMMPQITSGVNSQNRENNYSRRTDY